MLRDQQVDTERQRHDKAVEELQAAQAKWSKLRTERLDWINQELGRESHALQTFRDVDSAMHEYYLVTGKALQPLGLEPQLEDFYTPSGDQKNREFTFIVLGMAVVGIATFKLL